MNEFINSNILNINGDISNIKANIIVCPVSSFYDNMESTTGLNGVLMKKICADYPHIDKEYRKYIKHCNKNNINMFGTVQYVPTEVWAMGLVDTIRNNYIDTYDVEYKYIANLFCFEQQGAKLVINLDALKSGFTDICNKAKSVDAVVAIPHSILNNDTFKIIQDVLKGCNVKITIWS